MIVAWYIVIWLLTVEDGNLYGKTHTLKHYLYPVTCTTTQITTRAVLPMTVDGVYIIPNKKRFNPTEQMIVAYHKGTIVYAYKGIFNYNIDHDWTGGVLVDYKKIVDKCTRSGSPNVQPAPSSLHVNITAYNCYLN